jgi:uncharacterized protein YodC (DUF2158 family)
MWKIGDVVRLKSGGPAMTVQRLLGEGRHVMAQLADEVMIARGFDRGDPVCQWFAGSEAKTEAFRKESLEPVGPPAPPAP